MSGTNEAGGGGGRRGSLFDDLAGVAGGAFSVLAGARAEAEAAMRSQMDALVQRLELVRREELDAALEVARRALERAEGLEARVAALEAAGAADVPPAGPGGGPGEGLESSSATAAAVHPEATGGTTPFGSPPAVASGGVPAAEAAPGSAADKGPATLSGFAAGGGMADG